MKNKVPSRPPNREAVYDIIDGECDHLAETADGPIGEYLDQLSALIRRARGLHVEGQPASGPVAANHFRAIAGLAVRAMECHGAIPREYHVPTSAGIVGTMAIHDPGDKYARGD